MDCSPSGSSVHGIFQARILEWVAISFSRASSRPREIVQIEIPSGGSCHCLQHLDTFRILYHIAHITYAKICHFYKLFLMLAIYQRCLLLQLLDSIVNWILRSTVWQGLSSPYQACPPCSRQRMQARPLDPAQTCVLICSADTVTHASCLSPNMLAILFAVGRLSRAFILEGAA